MLEQLFVGQLKKLNHFLFSINTVKSPINGLAVTYRHRKHFKSGEGADARYHIRHKNFHFLHNESKSSVWHPNRKDAFSNIVSFFNDSNLKLHLYVCIFDP